MPEALHGVLILNFLKSNIFLTPENFQKRNTPYVQGGGQRIIGNRRIKPLEALLYKRCNPRKQKLILVQIYRVAVAGTR